MSLRSLRYVTVFANTCVPSAKPQRGATTVYFAFFAVIAFGFLVMAADFGRLYLIQGELQTAADAAALAAATRLVGANSIAALAHDQVTASFDSTTGNDNRFNLRLNRIGQGGSGLATTDEDDYFSLLTDARLNAGGATAPEDRSDYSSPYSKYVRVQINAQAPVLFAPLLNRVTGSLPTVTVSAIAGLSGPMCTVCGIDGLAVVGIATDGSDPVNYGFMPGGIYTLSFTGGGMLSGTVGTARYILLNHIPNGPVGLDDTDGAIFELAAGGLSSLPTLSPSPNITIDNPENLFPNPPSNAIVARDMICGLNVRFNADLTAAPCNAVSEFASLAMLFTADTDLGGGADPTMEDYATEYTGNLRRVLTVAIVDSATTPTVLNFRQFLVEPAPGLQTLAPSAAGAFRAQYIGSPVPLRCGAVGGMCSISTGTSPGVGKVVLH